MGWTWLYRPKGKPLRAFFDQEFSREGWKLLDCASTLGVSYLAVQSVGAYVVLTAHRPKDDFNFGYKDMAESMGPHESRCPERILKLLTPTDSEYALEWRKRCYDYLEKAHRPVSSGDIIRFAKPLAFVDETEHQTFKLVPQRTRGHYYFQAISTGKVYRITDWKSRDYELVDPVEQKG